MWFTFLQMAGQSVKKATETLVAAAQQPYVENLPSITNTTNNAMMSKFKAELEMAEKIALTERVLKQQRLQLTRIRNGQQNLQMADQSVKKATEALVAAAHQPYVENLPSITNTTNNAMMSKFKAELEIAETIAATERVLEQQRLQLTRIRKGQQN